MEIERKWLINEFPDIEAECTYIVLQGYLSIDPEVRIRSLIPCCPESNEYTLCIKGDGTIAREEIEVVITGEQFKRLKEMVPGTLINKLYKKYKLLDGTEVQCSQVDGGILWYAEVEFKPEEDPYAFNVPIWFGKEVTDDPEYKMKNYWRRWHSKCASTNQEK